MSAEARRFVVYGLVDPRDGSVRYIGRTKNLKKRLSEHLSGARYRQVTGNKRREAWISGLLAEGLRPETRVLEEHRTHEGVCVAEEWWIAHGLNAGWPLTNGHGRSAGPGPLGTRGKAARDARLAASFSRSSLAPASGAVSSEGVAG